MQTAFLPQPNPKLAHIRTLGQGQPGWNGTVRYITPGVSPSVSFYDAPSEQRSSQLHRASAGGVNMAFGLQDPGEPTATRDPRASAVFDSLPAGRFFQGAFATTFSWLGALKPYGEHTPLYQGWSPLQPGSKELHPATVYQPFPPMGAIVPKYV